MASIDPALSTNSWLDIGIEDRHFIYTQGVRVEKFSAGMGGQFEEKTDATRFD
jgi:hypothetical protein